TAPTPIVFLRGSESSFRPCRNHRRSGNYVGEQVTASSVRALEVRRLGLVPYGDALELQAELVQQRRSGEIPDTLLLLQHPHVITKGSGTHLENILLTESEREERGIELFEAGRGGDVTY